MIMKSLFMTLQIWNDISTIDIPTIAIHIIRYIKYIVDYYFYFFLQCNISTKIKFADVSNLLEKINNAKLPKQRSKILTSFLESIKTFKEKFKSENCNAESVSIHNFNLFLIFVVKYFIHLNFRLIRASFQYYVVFSPIKIKLVSV